MSKLICASAIDGAVEWVAKAEKKWLEMQKSIEKGRRARLPRPDIPNERYQHLELQPEVWLDEVGYIQHSIKSECM